MSGCCGESDEDGILKGRQFKIPKSHQKQITKIFEEELLLKHIKGSKRALEFTDNNELTFIQMNDYSTAIARNLRDRLRQVENNNPDGDSLIAISLPKSERAVCTIFGILKTGAAYAPLDPNFPEGILLDILKAFRPLLLITDENTPIFNKYDCGEIRQICPVVTLQEIWVELEVPSNDTQRNLPQDHDLISCLAKKNSEASPVEQLPAVVFYTRGLHGNPVGVRLCHLSIVNRIFFDWHETRLHAKDTCCLTACLSLVDSIPQIFSSLMKGCTLHVFAKQDLLSMVPMLKAVGTKNITRLSIPHHHFRNLLLTVQHADKKEIIRSLRHLKNLICRGGMFSSDDVRAFFLLFRGITLWQCNGPAETTGEVMYERFESFKEFNIKSVLRKVTLGKVMENTRIYILGAHLGIVSDGNQGEICVAGLCLGLGYVNEQNMKDRQAFIKNPHQDHEHFDTIFRSGEYGRILVGKDGKRHLLVEGRDDSLIKKNGRFFSAADVEAFLKEFDFTSEAYIFILHKGKPTQEVIAFIIPNGDAPDVQEIEFMLRAKIPEWAMPDEITLIDEMPTHILSDDPCPHCLVEQFLETREPKFDEWKKLGFTPEKQVMAATLIKSIYRYASIPAEVVIENFDKSFFQLGGNSNNAVTMLVHLNKLGYPVSIRDLYTAKNLNEFLKVMESKRNILSSLNQRESKMVTKIVKLPSTDEISIQREVGVLKPNFHIMMELADEFKIALLSPKYKRKAIELIAQAYVQKGELQLFNMVRHEEYVSYFTDTWALYEKEGVSIVVIRKSDMQLVGVALCLEFFTIIETTKANGALFHTIELLQEIKGLVINFMPDEQGETLEMCWMATHSSLSPVDNIRLTVLMHTELVKLANHAGFSGIYNATSNKMSRMLCMEVYGFMLLEDYRVNQYREIDGSSPFHLAGDLAVIAALYLKLNAALMEKISLATVRSTANRHHRLHLHAGDSRVSNTSSRHFNLSDKYSMN